MAKSHSKFARLKNPNLDGIYDLPTSNPWTSRSSGRQTERATCNYFKKIRFLENSFNKDKSVGL